MRCPPGWQSQLVWVTKCDGRSNQSPESRINRPKARFQVACHFTRMPQLPQNPSCPLPGLSPCAVRIGAPACCGWPTPLSSTRPPLPLHRPPGAACCVLRVAVFACFAFLVLARATASATACSSQVVVRTSLLVARAGASHGVREIELWGVAAGAALPLVWCAPLYPI